MVKKIPMQKAINPTAASKPEIIINTKTAIKCFDTIEILFSIASNEVKLLKMTKGMAKKVKIEMVYDMMKPKKSPYELGRINFSPIFIPAETNVTTIVVITI